MRFIYHVPGFYNFCALFFRQEVLLNMRSIYYVPWFKYLSLFACFPYLLWQQLLRNFAVIFRFKGKSLDGKKYKPLFNYFSFVSTVLFLFVSFLILDANYAQIKHTYLCVSKLSNIARSFWNIVYASSTYYIVCQRCINLLIWKKKDFCLGVGWGYAVSTLC